MMETISEQAIAILKDSEIGVDYITLPPGTLDRSLYEEVNEVISRLGGKWKKGGKYPDGSPKGKHCFMFEVPEIFNTIMELRVLPPKNPTAFFPTPKAVIDQMIGWSEMDRFWDDIRILEPSAGMGAIAEQIRIKKPDATLHCVEFLDINARSLKAKGFNVFHQDFMDYKPDEKYHIILMNPPFSLQGDPNAYITHIMHAWDMLYMDGILIAIAPKGYTFKDTKIDAEFRKMIDLYGEDAELPKGSFKESGTGVETNIIYLKKEDLTKLNTEKYSGYPCYYTFNFSMYVDNSQSIIPIRSKLYKDLSTCDGVDLFNSMDKDAEKLIDQYIAEIVKKARDERIIVAVYDKALIRVRNMIWGEYLDYKNEQR